MIIKPDGYMHMRPDEAKSKADYKAYLKRKQRFDGRVRASLENSPVVRQVKNWVLIRAKYKNSQWRLALVELKPDRPADKLIRISERDKTLIFLKQWEPLNRGKTDKCSWAVAMKDANAIMDKLEAMNIESASLLKVAGYFDQPWR